MRNIPLTKHLVARRFWHPSKRLWFRVTRPLLRVPFVWCWIVRCHSWLCRKAGRQRPTQLFRPSSLAYDLAAIGATLLAPAVKWERACRETMNQETDPRLRHDPSRN
jgi:hypothetical protein